MAEQQLFHTFIVFLHTREPVSRNPLIHKFLTYILFPCNELLGSIIICITDVLRIDLLSEHCSKSASASGQKLEQFLIQLPEDCLETPPLTLVTGKKGFLLTK